MVVINFDASVNQVSVNNLIANGSGTKWNINLQRLNLPEGIVEVRISGIVVVNIDGMIG